MPRTCLRRRFLPRFYFDPRTRVTTRAETRRARTHRRGARRAPGAARAHHSGRGVRAGLDASAAAACISARDVHRHRSQRVTSASAMAGRSASIASYRTRARFDLVICYDVLQYLTDAEAARAIANLGRLCRGALFFHAPTREDWRRNADRSCSDEDIHLRPTRLVSQHGWRVTSDTPASGSMSGATYRRCNGSWLKLLNRTKGQVLIPVRGNPVTFWRDQTSSRCRQCFFSRPLHAPRDCSLTRRS